MSKSTKSAPVTAAQVRAFARENGLTVGSRGRLDPAVSAAFAKATGRKYVEGTPRSLAVTVSYTQPSGRKAKAVQFVPEAQARSLAGDLAGKRGRLSAKALAHVAAQLGEVRSAKPQVVTEKV